MYTDDPNRGNESAESPRRLKTVDCPTLCETRFKRKKWLVDSLIKPGLAVLAGSPKIGKSWMVLQLCISLAQGEPFLNMKTEPCTTLYIALEDSGARLQERVLRQTAELPENLHFAERCSDIGTDLVEEIRGFVADHPDTGLIVIDTYQKIRTMNSQFSYANDYLETSALKALADSLNICILLVHHTRKMGDSDVINEISGTNGIAGSADTLMVLKKAKRSDRSGILSATGRDIGDRELELRLDREQCVWVVISDNREEQIQEPLPEVLLDLIAYMKQRGGFNGTNGLFCEGFRDYCKKPVDTKSLKQKMNRFRYELEDHGVCFRSRRTSSMRLLEIRYFIDMDRYAKHSVSDASGDASDDA